MADVRETAVDLLECALYAEIMMLLNIKVGLGPETISGFMSDVIAASRLSARGKRYFGCKSTITLTPGGSSKRREAVVLMQRGSRRGAVSPTAAREMAQTWLSAAEATESDHVVAEALATVGRLDDGWVEEFFKYLQLLRGGQELQDEEIAAELAREQPQGGG